MAIALVISAAINVHLFVRDPAPASERAIRLRQLALLSAPAQHPIGLLPADIDHTLPCTEQLAEVQRRIAAVVPELASRLTPMDKFEAGTADPGAEATIKPVFEAMFADAPGDFSFDVECRGGVCMLTVHPYDGDYDWPARVQDPEWRSRYTSRSFHANTAYLELRGVPSPP